MRYVRIACTVVGLLLVVLAAVSPAPGGAAAVLDGTGSSTATTLTSPTQLVMEGETWPQPMVAQLETDAGSAISPLQPSYFTPSASTSNPGGEDGARTDFVNGFADLAVSEAPLTSAETTAAQQAGIVPAYVPYAGGAVAVIVAVSTPTGLIQGLNLTVPTLCKIMTNTIKTWNNAEIEAENPGSDVGSALNNSISVVVRTDSSSTTAALISLFLSNPTAKSCWDGYATGLGAPIDTPLDAWPANANQVNTVSVSGGSKAVVQSVLDLDPNTGQPAVGADRDSIGYVAPALAAQHSAPLVAIQNLAQNFVLPTAANVESALADGAALAPTTKVVTIDPTKMTGANDYPIVLPSYLIVPTSGGAVTKLTQIAAFAQFVLGPTGQADVATTGYVAAPAAWVTAGDAVVSALQAAATATTTSTSSTSSTAPTSSTTVTSTTLASSVTSSTETVGATLASSSGGTVGPSAVVTDPVAAAPVTAASVLPNTGISSLGLAIAGVVLVTLGQLTRRRMRRTST